MKRLELFQRLSRSSPSRIVLVVIDGIGGLPVKGKTELETAFTPNLDKLAEEGICGMLDPVLPGVTPGSGPGHLALFGYDPLEFEVGRGVLSALGVGFPLQPGDIAARINFATVDEEGKVVDRRAGRISTSLNRKLCEKLQERIKIPGVDIFVKTEKEHRAVVIFRGKNLSDKISDTDPQKTGVPPKEPLPLEEEAKDTSRIVKEFLRQTREILGSLKPANFILMRGFASLPHIPTLQEIYKLHPACIAVYPMYKGIAKLVGMRVLETGESMEEEVLTLEENFESFDFFFLHFKQTDSSGEDGDFERKVRIIEEIDSLIPRIRKLNPEVLVVTGDHSTPSSLKSHSWHTVPVALVSPYARVDEVREFKERTCIKGGLGRMEAVNLMGLMMAHALKLEKFGA